MPAKKITPVKKLEILKKIIEEGLPVARVCRQYGVSRFSFYKWAKAYKQVQSAKCKVQSGEKKLLKLLEAKRSRGQKHFRSVGSKRDKLVLEVVLRNPHWSSHQISQYLKSYKNGKFYVSNHGVYNILRKHGLNFENARVEFVRKHPIKSVFPSKFSDFEKYRILEEAQKGEESVASICRRFHISRYTYYAWLKKYQKEKTVASLASNKLRGEAHPRFVGHEIRQQVLDLVALNPESSVHQLHRTLRQAQGFGQIGHHAVQNLLYRENLNTSEKRLQFAQGVADQSKVKVAPQYEPQIPVYRLRHLIAHFATIPKLALTNPKRGLPLIAFSFLPFAIFILWIRLLLTASAESSIVGLIFASIALTFGLFFFIYSLKYYITVLMVLKLAQSGARGPMPFADVQGKPISADQQPINADSSVNDQRSTVLNILRAISHWLRVEKFLGSSRLRSNNTQSRVNPLLVNLEKMKFEGERLFVSIHVAIYNEKRVMERLIQACTSQEWSQGNPSTLRQAQGSGSTAAKAAFEVVIVDDSTDETTEIAKQTLISDGWKLVRTGASSVIVSEAKQSKEEIATSSQDSTRNDNAADEIFVFTKPNAPTVKLIHRFSREGFKGGALQEALENTDARAKYICVFDADFVPYPDTIEQFVKTFQVLGTTDYGLQTTAKSDLATAVDSRPWTVDNNIAAVQPFDFAQDQHVGNNIAAVQGYQWHVLNKSQNWVTRGVRTEYAGSYVIERSGEEIYGGLKQIAGSVYCIRADVLRQFGWGTSITEDFELTLRLYEAGYKVAFTPYIQAPAEAVSTIKRLIRQRMRWAEGASFNVKCMLGRMLWGHWEERPYSSSPSASSGREEHAFAYSSSEERSDESRSFLNGKFSTQRLAQGSNNNKVWVPSKLTLAEKLEFIYLAPYYLQAAFFVIGTLSWFLSEAVFGARLPFWTAAFGWSLVFTNLLALPLMNIVGLFLEESDERDYVGIISFVVLSYIVVPFAAYAAMKGFLEKQEGPWFRTPKTGVITDVFGRSGFNKFFGSLLGGRPAVATISADVSRLAPNFALATAYNNFNFNPKVTISEHKLRFVGRVVLVVLLILTLSMNFFVISVPETYATNQGADFGLWTDIYCLSSTDCKISYRDASNLDLRMADCDNATCSSGGDRAVDEGGDVGDLQTSIYCLATDDCKIAYLDATNGNLKMADCDNETCDSATLTTVDPAAAIVGRFPSIYCPATDDCKIAYYDADNGDLRFADCGNATCSSVTLNLLDGRTGCTLTGCSTTSNVGRNTSIYCISSVDCKISYWDTTNENLMMADCDAADCSSGTATTVDTAPTISDQTVGMTSIYCISSTDCKIAYYDFTNPPRDLKMADCDDSACTAGNRTITTVDSTGDRGRYASIYCPATDDCKIAYRDGDNSDLNMADCGGADGTCATNTITAVDAGGDRGYYTSIYCISSVDCKISYYGTSTADLMFADCDDSACTAGNRTTGSVALTVPEFIGFLIPVAPFLPKVVKHLKNRVGRRRKAKKLWEPPKH